MAVINDRQLDLVRRDVDQARITLSHLSSELIDHICCETENLMEEGKTFEEAYAFVRRVTGIETLKEIQEDTRYLIDKKIRIMKTTVKITGNISLALIGLGTVLKICMLPGADVILLTGFLLLVMVFFPTGIYLSYMDKPENKNPFLNISILIGGVLFMAGILFKVMYWNGANIMLILGWSIILLIFLPILLYVKIKESSSGSERIIYIMGIISLPLFELGTMFKLMHWPGAAVFLVLGSISLVGIFISAYTYRKFKNQTLGVGEFIYIITLSMYVVALTTLISTLMPANIHH